LTTAITESFIAQGTPIGAMGGLALAAIVRLVRSMRSGGRRLDFLGLTGTMLGDEAASLIAGALNTLPARDPAAEAETVEILQVALSERARHQLQTAPVSKCSSAGPTGRRFEFADR